MSKTISNLGLLIGIVLVLLSCTKDKENVLAPLHNDRKLININKDIVVPNDCSLSYGSSIFFKDVESLSPVIIHPKLNPEGLEGIFVTSEESAECLDIDPKKGTINITKSASGISYQVEFITKTDTCKTRVLISGMRFYSGIFNINKGYKFMKPYYNANLQLSVPAGSKFDTPPQGVPTAASKGLVINKSTGVIDLDKSLAKGIFGQNPSD